MGKNTSDSVCALIDQWYKSFYTYIYWFILRYAKCKHESAEDLTQEVFERAFLTLQGLPEPIEYPKSWLLKIAENVCKRFKAASNRYPMSDAVHHMPDGEEKSVFDDLEIRSSEQPENVAEVHDKVQSVYKILETIPTEWRLAFLYHYQYGYSIEQIAKLNLVNRSAKTIRLYVHKTLELLKGQLEEQEHQSTL